MAQVIRTGDGDIQPVDATVTYPADIDVDGATVEVCVGTWAGPSGAWAAPYEAATISGQSVTAGMMIGPGFVNPPASPPFYYVYQRVTLSTSVPFGQGPFGQGPFGGGGGIGGVLIGRPYTRFTTTDPAGVLIAAAPSWPWVGPTAPNPAAYPAWFDTSSVPPVLKGWNGSAWVPIGGGSYGTQVLYVDTDGGLYYADGASASNVGLDTDGVPYFSAGANGALIFLDVDGVPYFEAA